MNYLAHAYLSFDKEEILVGNMISDFVKGKRKFDYSAIIQHGIMLHRQIDEFTDSHPLTKEAKKIFKPAVGPYAGAFLDIAYDHFLANDVSEFSNDVVLKDFVTRVYGQLQKHENIFPDNFRLIFPYMLQYDWLYNYKYNWGIEKSFKGIVRRAAYLSDSSGAFKSFEENHKELQQYYSVFFPQLKGYALQQFNALP